MENSKSDIDIRPYNILKVCKIISFGVMILAVIAAIALLISGSLAGLLSVPLLILALYYLIIGLVCNSISKVSTLTYRPAYIMLFLLLAPLIFFIIPL